jgi:hypothetical protein
MSNFHAIHRDTGFLLPPSIDEWLPEKHLAPFVVVVIGSLDLSGMTRRYWGSGSGHRTHPALLLGLLVYGYATGSFRAGSWNVRPMTRWRSGSSRRTGIPTTTRSLRFGGDFLREIEGACGPPITSCIGLARDTGYSSHHW